MASPSNREKPPFIGTSRITQKLLELVDTAAESHCTVLIEGESGTGKELIAHRLHQHSPRRDKPFIPVNAASISSGLFESELFGHTKGAFTGAEKTTLGLARCADGGTLFLDEIGEVPLSIQPKLLRLLQEGELIPVGSTQRHHVDVRFLSATSRDLPEEVRQERFRGDLFFRLSVVRIYIPPLRERPDDVDALLDYYLRRYAEKYEASPIRLTGKVQTMLREHNWPGNVRELASWVERLYVLNIPPEVLACSLGMDGFQPEGTTSRKQPMTLQESECEAIRTALKQTENNRSQAAKLLNIGRGTLLRKISQYNITDV